MNSQDFTAVRVFEAVYKKKVFFLVIEAVLHLSLYTTVTAVYNTQMHIRI